jgi:hypothetical protein
MDIAGQAIITEEHPPSDVVRFLARRIFLPFPPNYRFATLKDVRGNEVDAEKALPGWEIAQLADGWVDGSRYGFNMG